MTTPLSELHRQIEAAWSDLLAFLDGLTDEQASIQDDQGWTVSDHVTHIAVWEDSVAVLFRGRPRHEALGVDEPFYRRASFDEINERIRQNRSSVPLSQAIDDLRQAHRELMSGLAGLPQADLGNPVREVFPEAPRTDDRRVADFILENTALHFREHLEWMQDLVRTG